MTPTLDSILTGNALVIAGLASETGGQDYTAARLSVVAMLSLLAAQEAQAGAAARVAENAAIRRMLAATRDAYGGDAPAADTGLALHELDAVNAVLRRRLIALHEAVEARGDTATHRAILALYQDMARGRQLVMPQM